MDMRLDCGVRDHEFPRDFQVRDPSEKQLKDLALTGGKRRENLGGFLISGAALGFSMVSPASPNRGDCRGSRARKNNGDRPAAHVRVPEMPGPG